MAWSCYAGVDSLASYGGRSGWCWRASPFGGSRERLSLGKRCKVGLMYFDEVNMTYTPNASKCCMDRN